MRLLLIVMACVVASCSNTQKEENSSNAIGKYLYLDTFYSLHVNKNCWRIGSDITFVDTAQLEKNDYKYCNDCFTDSTYDHVQAIMQNDVDRKWLYRKFVEANYEMPPYRQFMQELSIEQKRRNAYNHAIEEEFDVGTFEEFSKMLGY